MIIIGGPEAENLDQRIAKELNMSYLRVKSKTFSDGDSFIKFPKRDLKGEDVVIVQTTFPDQNKRLWDMLFMIDTVKEFGAKSVTAVIPYLPYARQDRRFDEDGREVISIKTVLRSLEAMGLDNLITVDVHSKAIFNYSRINTESIETGSLIGSYFLGRGFRRTEKPSKVLVVAPDLKAGARANLVSKMLGSDFISIEKHRDIETGKVSFEFANLDNAISMIESKGYRYESAITIDDMITSGSTNIPVVSRLKRKGIDNISVACVHGVFVGDSLERLRAAGATDIVATDTISNPVAKISVAPLIAKSLEKLMVSNTKERAKLRSLS